MQALVSTILKTYNRQIPTQTIRNKDAVLKRLSEIEMSDEGEFRKVRRDRIFEKDYFDKKYGALPEVSDGFDLIEAMKG